MTKFNFTHLLVAGAVVSAVGAGAFVATEPVPGTSGNPVMLSSYSPLPADPGGGGCINGQCGSGGANGGPGGGPGGNGCVPTAYGTACGSGGANAGPGGLPGGTGCLPGIGCGGGHG
ncbi:MAG: PE-PGRS family protein [Mycobacterium sp.]